MTIDEVSSKMIVFTPLVLVDVAPVAGQSIVRSKEDPFRPVAGNRGAVERGARGADRMYRDEDRHSAKL